MITEVPGPGTGCSKIVQFFLLARENNRPLASELKHFLTLGSILNAIRRKRRMRCGPGKPRFNTDHSRHRCL